MQPLTAQMGRKALAMSIAKLWAEPPGSNSELDDLRARFAEEVEKNRRLEKQIAALRSENSSLK